MCEAHIAQGCARLSIGEPHMGSMNCRAQLFIGKNKRTIHAHTSYTYMYIKYIYTYMYTCIYTVSALYSTNASVYIARLNKAVGGNDTKQLM